MVVLILRRYKRKAALIRKYNRRLNLLREMILNESHYEDVNQELAYQEKEYIYENDEIVDRVVEKMLNRSKTGQSKYHSTMWNEIERDEKNVMDFMTDIQEEMMDAVLYLESAKECMRRVGLKHNLFTDEDGS